MKKNALLLSLMLAFTGISNYSNATVWRVNGSTNSGAPYSTIQSAHDAATTLNNDTLYVEGSAFSVGGVTISKVITVIGTGYFLGENPQTQATLSPSSVDYIYFAAGSDGSKVSGLSIGYIYFYGGNNLLINRNRISGSTYAIYNQSPVSNVIITQNYISGTYGINLSVNNANNFLISNNYITGLAYYYPAITTSNNFSGIISNNVINNGYLTISYATIKNNILLGGGAFTDNNNITTNNLCDESQFPAGSNLQNVNIANVFVGTTGTSTDGQWKLKAGSPALGYGEGGVDCGMYGGPYPYILSGMPNIPAIYYFNAPSLPTNSINVSIKAKSHN